MTSLAPVSVVDVDAAKAEAASELAAHSAARVHAATHDVHLVHQRHDCSNKRSSAQGS